MIAPSRVGDGTDLGLGQTGLSENSICGLGSVMFNRYAASSKLTTIRLPSAASAA